MITVLQSVSVKSLALRVLREMATRRGVQEVCPTPAVHARQGAGQDTGAREVRREGLSPCGSAHCAGCYDVGDGKKIHPPKCGEKYRKWQERWQPKGKPQ